MTNPISGMSFQPGHGGGGGTFYMGRQDQPDDQDEQEESEKDAPGTELQGDRMTLEAPRRSGLALPGLDEETEPAENWEATSAEIKNNLRYMNLAVSHLERDFARRQHVEIGSVTIKARTPKPQEPGQPKP